MNGNPLALVIIAFMIGIVMATYTGIPFGIFWSASISVVILSLVFVKKRWLFLVFLSLSIIFLGAAMLRDSEVLSHNHIAHFTPRKGEVFFLEGIVDSDPVTKKDRASFILDAKKLARSYNAGADDAIDVSGRVLVKIFGRHNFSYGERVLIEGKLYKAPYFRISNKLNYRDYLEHRGIYSIFSLRKDSYVSIVRRGEGNPLKSALLSLRKAIKNIFDENLSEFSSGMLNAIILGDRGSLSKESRDTLVHSGTVHIISISGLHAGIMSFIVLMVFKILRLPRKVSYILVGVFLMAYCVLTGARIPVVRVTLMALIVFIGLVIDRRVNIYNTLSLAAFIILLFNPQQLFDIGFQLSFASVLSIAWLSPKIISLSSIFLKEEEFFSRAYLRIPITLMAGSLAAWIGLLPLIAYYFNIISPIAIVANMIAVPYLSVILGSAILLIIFSPLHPVMATAFAATNEAALGCLFKLIRSLLYVPGAYFHLPGMEFGQVVIYYIFLIFLAKK